MATLLCIKGGRKMNSKEMLDKIASQNYQLAAENARLRQEIESLREVLVECRQALSLVDKKTLPNKTRQMLAKLPPEPVRAKAAAQV